MEDHMKLCLHRTGCQRLESAQGIGPKQGGFVKGGKMTRLMDLCK